MSVFDPTGNAQTNPFTRPVRRADNTVNADVVRSNDNSLRESANTHDSDAEAHLGGASSFIYPFLLYGG